MSNNTIYSVGEGDFILANSKHVRSPSKSYFTERIAYYQTEVHRLSCSLHACMTVVSNQTGYEFTLKERKAILKLAISRGFDVNMGWYMNKAVKCVTDYCNDELDMNLVYARVHWTQYEDLAEKGFGIVCGYKSRAGMGRDRSDGILGDDGIKYGSLAYGHLVSFWNYAKRTDQRKPFIQEEGRSRFGMVDNYYPKHKNNETFIDNLSNMVSQDTIFKNGYIIYDKKLTKAFTLLHFKQKIRDMRKILIK